MDSIRSVLASEHKKSLLKHRAYMMLIGNYGRHMAFATDPPNCVAYAVDYKNTSDPSKMTPCEPLNHAYAMVTGNMVVRRLLSVPNWELGRKEIDHRGLHSHSEGHAIWSRVVSRISRTAQPCMGPLVNFSHMQQEVPFHTHLALLSNRFDISWPSRGSGIVHS